MVRQSGSVTLILASESRTGGFGFGPGIPLSVSRIRSPRSRVVVGALGGPPLVQVLLGAGQPGTAGGLAVQRPWQQPWQVREVPRLARGSWRHARQLAVFEVGAVGLHQDLCDDPGQLGLVLLRQRGELGLDTRQLPVRA
jgi:hypothetical protein